MQLSRGHIDSLVGASFPAAYFTPVQFVSKTSQPSEYSPSTFQVLSSVTVSIVNDPLIENANGNIVVTKIKDAGTGGAAGAYGYVNDRISMYYRGSDFSNLQPHNPNLGHYDPYIPSTTYLTYSLGESSEFAIVGFSPVGILVDVHGDLEGNTPYNPEYETYFVISSTNLGVNPGAQFTFYRYGEFDGVLGDGGAGGGTAPPQSNAGQAAMWTMRGTTLTSGGAVTPNPGSSWKAVGMGDFNGDGHSDILWQATSGQAAIWELIGTDVVAGGAVSVNPGPNWTEIGTGDFNGDGHSDILWQNASGRVAIWEMNGTNVIGGGTVSSDPGPTWHAIGTGDFNHDHHSDILWQNVDGQVAIWEMNGASQIAGGSQILPVNPGPSWHAIGAGDFFGYGDSDILFQNADTGQVAIWRMNGTNIMGGGVLNANPGPTWHAVGAGDFFNPGLPGLFADILFQNASSGQVAIWGMDGTSIVHGGIVGSNPGPSSHAIGANGADILFQTANA